MAYNKRFDQSNQKSRTIKCNCGGISKLFSRKNYTHGRKSTSLTSWFYKCPNCKNQIYHNVDKGGKK